MIEVDKFAMAAEIREHGALSTGYPAYTYHVLQIGDPTALDFPYAEGTGATSAQAKDSLVKALLGMEWTEQNIADFFNSSHRMKI